MVSQKDALYILTLAEHHGITLRLDGGWGVDALLGEQTRPHHDLDVFVERREGERFIDIIGREGFTETKMEYTTPSHTVWTDGANRVIDLHLFSFGPKGAYIFEGTEYPPETFGATGRIGDREVICIPSAEQVRFHTGYEHDENDRCDVEALCRRFDLPIPKEYLG